ncbi:MAG: hypothetical protein SFZ02_15395 [bacterium]|nr:hypothetical protein [bacterium]
MTLQDILEVIDTLPREDLETIQQRIQRKQKPNHKPLDKSIWEQEWVKTQMQAIDQETEPVELVAGTMDADKFLAAMKAMHDELSAEDIDAIARAMNEEYIPEDKT